MLHLVEVTVGKFRLFFSLLVCCQSVAFFTLQNISFKQFDDFW